MVMLVTTFERDQVLMHHADNISPPPTGITLVNILHFILDCEIQL
jgi:hypothetical protein